METFITTIDNPYDPFTQSDDWYSFDIAKGYDTCGFLARIAKTSDALSDAQNERIINDAIDEIIEMDVLGIYKKVTSKIDD